MKQCHIFTSRARSFSAKTHFLLLLACTTALSVSSCTSPRPGPDKTVAGTILGAGWGAGAGAAIGNQVDATGKGVAVGAGFGAVSGALIGGGFDIEEGQQVAHQRELDALRLRTAGTQMELEKVMARLDDAALTDGGFGVYQVFFDDDATSVRAGAVQNLERIAETIKTSPHAVLVKVDGHSDDTGSTDYNEKLAQARADSVAAFLAAHGVSTDRMKTSGHAATKPLGNNVTAEGRQLNRRVDVYISR